QTTLSGVVHAGKLGLVGKVDFASLAGGRRWRRHFNVDRSVSWSGQSAVIAAGCAHRHRTGWGAGSIEGRGISAACDLAAAGRPVTHCYRAPIGTLAIASDGRRITRTHRGRVRRARHGRRILRRLFHREVRGGLRIMFLVVSYLDGHSMVS